MSISKIPVEDIEPKTRAVQMTEDFFAAYNNKFVFDEEERAYARKYMRSIIYDQMDAEFKAGLTNIPARQLTTPCPSPFVWDLCWIFMLMSASSFSACSALLYSFARGDKFFGVLSYIFFFIFGIMYVGLPYCFFQLSYNESRIPESKRTIYAVALIVYTYLFCLALSPLWNHI